MPRVGFVGPGKLLSRASGRVLSPPGGPGGFAERRKAGPPPAALGHQKGKVEGEKQGRKEGRLQPLLPRLPQGRGYWGRGFSLCISASSEAEPPQPVPRGLPSPEPPPAALCSPQSPCGALDSPEQPLPTSSHQPRMLQRIKIQAETLPEGPDRSLRAPLQAPSAPGRVSEPAAVPQQGCCEPPASHSLQTRRFCRAEPQAARRKSLTRNHLPGP